MGVYGALVINGPAALVGHQFPVAIPAAVEGHLNLVVAAAVFVLVEGLKVELGAG